MKKIITIYALLLIVLNSCDYLDVVPDNIQTLEENFTMRALAERSLFTCYGHLPTQGNISFDPAIACGDEYWFLHPYITTTSAINATMIAMGYQGATSPYLDYWNGTVNGSNPFNGIRDCNILIENIDKVPDMQQVEKDRWRAEAKFLKAYYHFWLFRMYGPIPLIKENLPINAKSADMKLYREPVDECVDYMVQLLDEAAPYLPEKIDFELTELGRITKTTCLAVKAQILVTAASPLFNSFIPEYEDIEDGRGVRLFNNTRDNQKWVRAADACKEAVILAEKYFRLYEYANYPLPLVNPSDETKTLISVRNSVSVKWNGEIIWANNQSLATSSQKNATPPGIMSSKYPSTLGNTETWGRYSPPLKIAEMFYSANGLPLSEDKTYDYDNRHTLKKVPVDEKYKYYLQLDYTTVGLHIDREPRFYASLAFDGGLWFGQGNLDDNNQYLLRTKVGQFQVAPTTARTNVTGYWPKKLVNYESAVSLTSNSTYTLQNYPWPLIRLADLYLLYAEALNEAYGPLGDPDGLIDEDSPYTWLNKVRQRAGIPTIAASWDNYAKNPEKYKTQSSLREIIQQERLIELAFEGSRFWDLRRWRLAHIELNKPITGWDYNQSNEEYYYRERVLYNQTFSMRDYFWPIRESELLVNKNLIQNYGY